MSDPLYVSFLWHMHQPYYKDPVQGEYVLPWTYLHAVKDYYDMPAVVDATPGAKVVFNLVPSLLEQIEEYARGEAYDPFLEKADLPPADLSEEERLFIIDNFFSANRKRMIEPHDRYFELYCLAGDGSAGGARDKLRLLRDQDLLDLQVWFFLAWTGEAARRRFPQFGELIRKGKHFNASDKALLFQTQRELIGEIIPLYRKLHEEGKAELSVTPYFHPILPLLCDSRVAQVAMPKANLPTIRFRHPEDARSQVLQGIACFERIFGFRPQGMWPSEGSVSDEALGVLAQCGLQWAATDEAVLHHSLPSGLGRDREALYRPYAFREEGREVALFFRDHVLSDLIGFTYSQWETDRSVNDFMGKLKEIRSRCHGAKVVPVILDGENAWEYYPENGLPFLTRLYGAIAESRQITLATFSEVLEQVPERRPLTHIHPGSWINANYGIWIGHPEENLAWDLVARARAAAVEKSPEVARLLRGEEGGSELSRLICKSLYAAEGSDWFWWFGDDHFSAHSGSFDLLFRRHLMNVYRLLDLDVPHELYEPIKKKSPAGFVREPAAMISPAITGMVTDYFEWLAAGLYDLTKQASAMHVSQNLLQSLFYGYDLTFFYLRIDGVQSLDKILQPGDILSLRLIHGREYRLDLRLGGREGELKVKGESGWSLSGALAQYRILRIAEARIPLSLLNLTVGDKLFVYLTLTRGAEELGRWPVDSPLLLNYLGGELEMETWLI